MSCPVSPWIYPLWDSLCFLGLVDYFLSHIREAFNYNLFKYFLSPFLFLFFWDPYNSNVGAFNVVPEVSETVLFSFFSLFCFVVVISTILSFSSLVCSSASVILVLIQFREILISFIVLFITVFFFCALVLLGPC